MIKRITLAILGLVAIIGVVWAQNPHTVNKVPIRPSSPTSGREMFLQYCAPCHGTDGKGDGPAAAALRKAPADLTTLAARNNGKFPEARVAQYIQGDAEVTAHGSRDMPIWGDLFRQLDREPGIAQIRISNLESYIKSIHAR